MSTNKLREDIREAIKIVFSPEWDLIGPIEERKRLLRLLHEYFTDINFGYEPYGILITVKIREWVTDHKLNPFIKE